MISGCDRLNIPSGTKIKPVKITGPVTFSRYIGIAVDCLMGHVVSRGFRSERVNFLLSSCCILDLA